MDLPRVVSTDRLRERGFDLPGLAPEVLRQLHPYGQHLAYETTTFGEVEPIDITLCTVLALTEQGDVMRILHQFRDKEWEQLPTVDRLLRDHARLAEESAVRSVVEGLEACLGADRGYQQELPFE
ncbi:MAG: hypothetical protein WD184_03025 [Acidimicrobiia bacterium]